MNINPSKTEKTKDPTEMDRDELIKRYRNQYKNITICQRQIASYKNNVEIDAQKIGIIVKKIRILEVALREIITMAGDDTRKVAEKALADTQLNRQTIISKAVQTLQ